MYTLHIASKIAYLPVHFASLSVDNPRHSAATPAVLALIEIKPKFVLQAEKP